MLKSRGVLYIIIASFFFGVINALVKYLGKIPAIEIVFFRALISFILSYISVKRLNLKIITDQTPLLLMRGICGAVALILYFYSIQNMPLATAVTLLYLAPIFTVLFAIVLVKEKPLKAQWPFMLLCFIGAALMKNFDPRVSLFHFSLAITAAIFAALAYNAIRLLKGKAHSSLIILYFPLVTIPLTLPWLFKYWVTPNTEELILLISIGIFTQLAQEFMTKAYLLESAAKISHFNYLTCFYAFAAGIILFNEHLNTLSIIGLFFVFFGIIANSWIVSKANKKA